MCVILDNFCFLFLGRLINSAVAVVDLFHMEANFFLCEKKNENSRENYFLYPKLFKKGLKLI